VGYITGTSAVAAAMASVGLGRDALRGAKVGRLGLEPSTLGLKVPCSTR
jgi:hypothetical protein